MRSLLTYATIMAFAACAFPLMMFYLLQAAVGGLQATGTDVSAAAANQAASEANLAEIPTEMWAMLYVVYLVLAIVGILIYRRIRRRRLAPHG